MLSGIQQQRYNVIKLGLNNQLKALNEEAINKPDKTNQINALHDQLESYFKDYLLHIESYLQDKLELDDMNIDNKISEAERSKHHLNNHLESLKEQYNKEKKQEVFVPNKFGEIEKTKVESTIQKKLLAELNETTINIVEVNANLTILLKQQESAYAKHAALIQLGSIFEKNCINAINKTLGNFTLEKNKTNRVYRFFSSFNFITNTSSSADIFEIIKTNIHLAVEKVNNINFFEAEFYGLIEAKNFQAFSGVG